MLARNYDPLIGRFMQVDPALLQWSWQDNLNKNNYAISPYNYVRNNPMIRIDLDGYTDWSALFWGAARTAVSASTVAGGYTMILAGSGVTAASLGASTPVSVPTVMTGIGGVVYGTTEFTFGIVDMKVAWHTPDGMSAESMRSLLSIITKGVTGSEEAANVVSLIESLKSAGTITKSINNDLILDAVYNLQNLINDATKVGSDVKAIKEKENEDD
jgi:RHS repeat-associated protein